MFKNIAEDIVFLLIRKNLLNNDNREIYTYAIEVILLNFSLLMTLFIISLITGQLLFFLCYLFFFIPLRVFSGGYHAKKSEICFVLSVASYVISMVMLNANLQIYKSVIILIITIVIIVGILLRAPIENINHPLSDTQKNRNKIIVRVIVGIDFTLLMIFCINRMTMASYQIVFIILNGLTFGVGQIENYIISKER